MARRILLLSGFVFSVLFLLVLISLRSLYVAQQGPDPIVETVFRVNTLGQVDTAYTAKRIDPDQSEAACEMAMRLVFRPGMSDGKPVPVWMVANIPVFWDEDQHAWMAKPPPGSEFLPAQPPVPI